MSNFTESERSADAVPVDELFDSREAVPEPRRGVWRLVLAWLPVVLVTDARAVSGMIGAPLGG